MRYLIPTLIVVIACPGCGGSGKPGKEMGRASGKITLESQPVSTGRIQFFDTKDNDVAEALIEKDGTFTVRYKGGVDIPSGRYRVSIGPVPPSVPNSLSPNTAGTMPTPPAIAPSPVPDKFRNEFTSGLEVTILPNKANVLSLDL